MFASNTSQVSSDAVYVEDVFSTYLYTGNGGPQTITNGIDLAGKGGLVWMKGRTANPLGTTYDAHVLCDTNRGIYSSLSTNLTNGTGTYTGVYAYNSDGFRLDGEYVVNRSGVSYTSWTFRKQPKFFDVVTFATDSSGNATVSHSLGATPGCILIKKTSGPQDWKVYHRSLNDPTNRYLELNSTSSEITAPSQWITVSSTQISFPGNRLDSSSNYVAYLFAHDAGGFGTAGTDNVISCGSVTMPSAGGSATVTLGWEPQWVLMKDINHTGGAQWLLIDNMRGWPASVATANTQLLRTYQSNAESGATYSEGITSTGFQVPSNFNYADDNTKIIYIAIRRGPMKTPTSGTQVFAPVTRTGTGATANLTGVGFPPDIALIAQRVDGGPYKTFWDKLRGPSKALFTTGADSEASYTTDLTSFNQDGISLGNNSGTGYTNYSGWTYVNYYFRRVPSFMDEVCYSGTGSARTVTHNLGAAPEMMIVKRRDSTGAWSVYSQSLGNTKVTFFDTAATINGFGYWNNTSPTSSVFTVNTNADVNASGGTYVAYLFASCPGVSKVGTYTGNGSSQTINCGFTGGARFILIKRTSATGHWYMWDTARGIVSANDPYLTLTSIATEVTTDDSIDPDSTGFIVNQNTTTNINVNAATYIYLAIA